MSPENTSTSAQDAATLQEIHGLIQARVTKLERSFKMVLGVGVAVVVIVLIYMNYLYSNFKDVVKAESLADFVTSEVTRRIPEVGREVEGHLKSEAPRLVQTLKTTFIEESIPMVRKVLQQQLTDFSSEFIGTAPDVLSEEVYAQVIKANRDRLKKVMDQGPEALKDPQYRSALVEKLQQATDERMKKDPRETVTKKMQASLDALKRIQTKLQQLSSKSGLNREEMLMKKLVSTWYTALDDTDQLTKKEWAEAQKMMKEASKELIEGTLETVKNKVEGKEPIDEEKAKEIRDKAESK